MLDLPFGNAYGFYDLPVEHTRAARGNGTKCEFFLSRNAEFARKNYVQRSSQRSRHLKGDWDAAPRNPEYNYIVAIRVCV